MEYQNHLIVANQRLQDLLNEIKQSLEIDPLITLPFLKSSIGLLQNVELQYRESRRYLLHPFPVVLLEEILSFSSALELVRIIPHISKLFHKLNQKPKSSKRVRNRKMKDIVLLLKSIKKKKRHLTIQLSSANKARKSKPIILNDSEFVLYGEKKMWKYDKDKNKVKCVKELPKPQQDFLEHLFVLEDDVLCGYNYLSGKIECLNCHNTDLKWSSFSGEFKNSDEVIPFDNNTIVANTDYFLQNENIIFYDTQKEVVKQCIDLDSSCEKLGVVGNNLLACKMEVKNGFEFKVIDTRSHPSNVLTIPGNSIDIFADTQGGVYEQNIEVDVITLNQKSLWNSTINNVQGVLDVRGGCWNEYSSASSHVVPPRITFHRDGWLLSVFRENVEEGNPMGFWDPYFEGAHPGFSFDVPRVLYTWSHPRSLENRERMFIFQGKKYAQINCTFF